MKFIKAILKEITMLRSYSQLEQLIRSKQPKTHSELERIIRDYYSCRGM
jgi:hypothetical protein